MTPKPSAVPVDIEVGPVLKGKNRNQGELVIVTYEADRHFADSRSQLPSNHRYECVSRREAVVLCMAPGFVAVVTRVKRSKFDHLKPLNWGWLQSEQALIAWRGFWWI